MFSKTGPLRDALEELIPNRPFGVRFWDGREVPATVPDGPTFTVRSPLALRHVLRAPGQLGIGRAYVCGHLDVDDLDAALEVVDCFEAPPLEGADRLRLVAALVRGAGIGPMPKPPRAELRLRGSRRHLPGRDRRAVRHHYDISNDFFALYLDRSMTYSCGVWKHGAESLEEAQWQKRELVCRKLGLQAGQRVLDVGCGWGSFVIHAVREYGVYGVGITLSEPQARLAREQAQAAGVADRTEFRVMDYREVDDGPYDAIASIGMVEHVGREQIDAYMGSLRANLKPRGRLLNHGIARMRPFEGPAGPFSERFVFPDGDPLTLSAIVGAMERGGLEPHHVEGLRLDYARTLREWAGRLDEDLAAAEKHAGAERVRVWRLYLRAARRGFESGFTSIYQVLATRYSATAPPPPDLLGAETGRHYAEPFDAPHQLQLDLEASERAAAEGRSQG